jgi:DivIVA domain-containing protein
MASSEMRDENPAPVTHAAPPGPGAERSATTPAGDRRPPHRVPGRATGAAERDRMLKEARNVHFPVAVRGYQRAAVDAYVERVNRLIAELEMYSSPESAVRHALDEVSEETREILQRAHETAEEITMRSRARADERLQQAEREAGEMLAAAEREAREAREAAQREVGELREAAQREVGELREAAQREAEELLESARRQAGEALEQAERRAMELARSAEAMWRERRRLIDDVRAVGEQLVSLGELEAKRFPRPPEEVSPANGSPAADQPAADQPAADHTPVQPA